MESVRWQLSDDCLTFYLHGRIDSMNAPDVEDEIVACCNDNPSARVVVDLDDLEYISSAGLRVILRLGKEHPNVVLRNASSTIYEVLDMTGFTELFEVTRAYRRISVDGCECIGKGANGMVYRIDPETVVKVYRNPDALPEIKHERDLARTAFVQGLPTAIPYDVVRVGDSYGSVFELLGSQSLAELLIEGKMSVGEVAHMSADLLKLIHATEVQDSEIPSERAVVLGWAEFLVDYLPKELSSKLCSLVSSLPETKHLIHGDFHIKNVMVQQGECLLIDMDTLCHGHPIFELASMYNAYVGFGETDASLVENFLGVPIEVAHELWDGSLRDYLGDVDEQVLHEVEEKAIIIGQMRIMRRAIRRTKNQTIIDKAREHLEELVPKYDTLEF